MPNATTDGPSSFDPTPAPSEFETHLEKWLPPLLTLLGSYSTGVIYLRFKMNMGGAPSLVFAVRRNFVPHTSSVPIRIERVPMAQLGD